MITSLYNGISGIKAHQSAVDLLSENVSNVNTPGYRASSPLFSTIFSRELNSTDLSGDPTANEVGYGSIFGGGYISTRNGSLIDSDNKYDLAIQGSGLFGLQTPTGEIAYTRSGNFSKDSDGMLVDSDGYYVMGISANNINNGRVIDNPTQTIKAQKPGSETAIKIPDSLIYPSTPTKVVTLKGSLDPSIEEKLEADGSKVQVANVEVFRTDVQDAKGNSNRLEVTFTKRVPQVGDSSTWEAKAKILDENGDLISTNEGVLEFNGYGALLSNTLTTIDNNGTPLKLNLGTSYQRAVANSGYDGLKLTANVDDKRIEKDGVKEGVLKDYYFDESGVLYASFDNGKSIPISKVAVYHFVNEEGLEKVGNTSFKESANSGKPTFYIDEKGNFSGESKVLSSKTELSNVDLTTALTELIAMQKAFDANSKSITTSDQLIQNAINMKK